MVPIYLDALHITTAKQVVGSLADFSVLPHLKHEQDQWYDVNSDVAYISENAVAEPFSDRNGYLPPGLHLHWALPDALTSAVHTEPNTGKIEFPTVPNRWLIIRSGNNVSEKKWIVESDYLSLPEAEESSTKAAIFPKVTFPTNAVDGKPPFRYLGRSYPLGEKPEGSGQYLKNINQRLTAVGYGEPTFAAFYLNCHSVFGFFDDEFSDHFPEGVCYDVIGWYSDETDDPLRNLITNLESNATRQDCLDAIQQRFKWKIVEPSMPTSSSTSPDKSHPEQILCYSRLILEEASAHDRFDPSTASKNLEVVVANTGTEALSAYLSNAMTEDRSEQKQIENQLESLHLSSILQNHRLDLGPKFEEARHSKTFAPVSAGTVWTVAPQESKKPADASKSAEQQVIKLPSEVAHQLHQLNQLQLAYDRGWAEIESRQQQIYSDWYKYMTCCYRPMDANSSDYPSADLIMLYLKDAIAELNRVKAFVSGDGTVQSLQASSASQIGGPGGTNNVDLTHTDISVLGERIFPPRSDFRQWYPKLDESISTYLPFQSIWDYLKAQLQIVADAIAHIDHVILQATPAPRFWQPNEPVVLLVGEGMEVTDRHGQDGTLQCHGIDCDTIDITSNSSPAIAVLREKIHTIQSSVSNASDIVGFGVTHGKPWHPLFLEWAVEIAPLVGKADSRSDTGEAKVSTPQGNVTADTREYDSDFVLHNFELSETHCEFLCEAAAAVSIPSSSIFSGRAVLSAHSSEQLIQQIESYLVNEVTEYLRQNPPKDQSTLAPDDQKAHLDFLEAHKDQILLWCDQDYHLGLLTTYLNTVEPIEESDQLSPAEKKRHELLSNPPKVEDRSVFFEANKQAILAWFNEQVEDSVQEQAPIHRVLEAWERLRSFKGQSQAFGGFNTALLMHHQTLQLDIADPLAFPEYKSFTEETVRSAVGKQNRFAPLPHLDFHPLRTGDMQVFQLQVVDTFGQVLEIEHTHVKTTEQLEAPNTWVSLPARITQPSRINFRWLSASDDQFETSAHAETSPICGWVLPNNLDNSLMIYDSDGVALGYIEQTGVWRSPPGRIGPALPYDIPNPHLRQMVTSLCRTARKDQTHQDNFISHFIDVIDSALENIDPENFAQHEARALLTSNPMALVRAMVNLELKGLPATHQGWEAFRRRLDGQPPKTDNFCNVKFPIRIGEHMQLNDGVVGYWIENEDGTYLEDKFFAPQSTYSDELSHDENLVIYHSAGQPLVIEQSINDPPHLVSILMDPRGSLHCTSGVLPTKVLTLPKEHYAAALSAINVTFLSAPLLTEQGQIRMSLPEEPGFAWSWLQRDAAGWTELTAIPVVEREVFLKAFTDGQAVWDALVQNGWIQLITLDRANVVPTDRRLNASADAFIGKTDVPLPDIERVLELSARSLKPTETLARLGLKQEIREGWLELSPSPAASPQP